MLFFSKMPIRWPFLTFFLILELSLQKTVCSAQELPRFRTPAFDYSISHRQNVCDRQQAWHNRTVLLRDALEGLELHAWLPFGAFSSLNPDTGAIVQDQPGFYVEILDEVARRGRFKWRDSFGVTDLRVEIGNRSLDELLQWTLQTYDIAAAQWSKNVRRINSGASFPEGVFDGSIIMVGIQESDSKLDIWSFLEPFEWSVWVMIVVTFLVAGLTYMWMEWFNEDSDRQELGNKPTETVYFAALSFTGDIKYEPSTDYARLFVFALAFWSLLMASAYTANLASFLVVENTPSLQVESVEQAVRLNLPMCVLADSTNEVEVLDAHPGVKLIRFPASGGEEPIYQGVTRGECTLALTTVGSWDRYQRNSKANRECRLSWIGRVFRFIPSGLATFSDSGTFCTSLIRDVFNLHLLEMHADGFIRTEWKKAIEATADINCDMAASDTDGSGVNDSNIRLSFTDMGGLFIFFYGLTGIAVCMALFQKWNHKRKMKQNIDQEESAVNDVATQQAWRSANESADETMKSVRAQVNEIRQQLNDQTETNRRMDQQMSDILLMLESVEHETETSPDYH